MFKPSEYTPLVAAKLVEILEEAGFPPTAFSILYGKGETGRALVTHPAVDAVAFIGSHDTGEAIVRAAGLKRTLMELSGNGPQIVLDDASLEAAASLATFGATYVSGQCCVATERLLVQEQVHEEFVERLVKEAGRVRLGDPLAEDTTMGPLNNRPVADKVDRHLADARDRHVAVLTGGGRAEGFPTDLFYELTVLDRVPTDSLLFRDESFGPVLPVTTFADDEEAIRLANDTHLGSRQPSSPRASGGRSRSSTGSGRGTSWSTTPPTTGRPWSRSAGRPAPARGGAGWAASGPSWT